MTSLAAIRDVAENHLQIGILGVDLSTTEIKLTGYPRISALFADANARNQRKVCLETIENCIEELEGLGVRLTEVPEIRMTGEMLPPALGEDRHRQVLEVTVDLRFVIL